MQPSAPKIDHGKKDKGGSFEEDISGELEELIKIKRCHFNIIKKL